VNILYIDHNAGTPQLGMEYRPYFLAREWVRAGHRVAVVAASFSHVRARQPDSSPRGTSQRIDGIDYHWIRTPRYAGNGVGRAVNIACFFGQLWRNARRLAQAFSPDVVIASSTYPMDIWVARRIAQSPGARRAKLVYEVHDLWPLSLIELAGMSPYHPFARLCQHAEDAAYRDADCVVSMLPKVHEHMVARGLDLSRLTIVPNGVSPDDWTTPGEALRDDVAQAIARLRAAGRVVIGYAGSMGLPNALDTLLDAARLVQDAGLGFVLVGDGHERRRLEQRIAQETIANMTLLPPIPKAQIASFLSAIEIAYIGWRRSPIYRFGIAPNKLMDYMMAGCAVLHSVEAGNDPVAESGCGLTVAPESADAVARGLRVLAAKSAAERRAMGESGRAYVLANHGYPVLARRFLDAVCR
jgi:glycosyltransferase involved in cell wall biosynthesis